MKLYLVWIWEGCYDDSAHLQIIFADRDDAINYASNTYLPHKAEVWVAEEELDVPCPSRAFKRNYVYRRQHYDPLEALFEEIRWTLEDFYCKSLIDKEGLIKYCINNYSPMCINIDWDRLYKRYIDYADF